jgi:sugar fermentation stimulation protein A
MRFFHELVPGRLLFREKRFLASVRLDDGSVVTAHCANTGGMLGCKEPGSRVWLSPADSPKRKLAWTWELVAAHPGSALTCVNTQQANRVAREGLEAGVVKELAGFDRLRPEVKAGPGTRFDFLLEWGPEASPTRRCWVEVKSVTLAEGSRAMFPDAVTERGRKHLRELSARVAAGEEAAMLFVVLRQRCRSFEPAAHIDPAYAEALAKAQAAGVKILVYAARVTSREIRLQRALPWRLS